MCQNPSIYAGFRRFRFMKKQAQFFALTEHVFSMLRKDKEQKIAKVRDFAGFRRFWEMTTRPRSPFANFLILVSLFFGKL